MAKSATFNAVRLLQANSRLSSSVQSEEVSDPNVINIPDEQFLRAIKFLEDLSDEDYVTCIEAIIRDHKHLVLENEVMTAFLKFYEPQMIGDIAKVKKLILELDKESPLLPRKLEQPAKPSTPIEILFSDEGARLNVSVRQDLLLRFLEDMDAGLKKFSKRMKAEKSRCHATIEEATISLEEITDARNTFEDTMARSIDPQTKRVPAEKFIWFLEEWLKGARQLTEKFRLRNFSLKGAYRKCRDTLELKAEMGKTLHAVDFEQMDIQNAKLRDQVENVTAHLQELKQFNGKANLALSTTKIYLQALMGRVKKIKVAMSKCDRQTEILHRDAEESQKKLEEVKSAYTKVKYLINSCKAPDTLEYLRIKAHLSDLEKTKKILERKENLQHITLQANKRMLMHVTGAKTFRKEWLQKCIEVGGEDDMDFNPESTMETSEFDIFKVFKSSPGTKEEETPTTNDSRNSLKPRKLCVKSKKVGKPILR